MLPSNPGTEFAKRLYTYLSLTNVAPPLLAMERWGLGRLALDRLNSPPSSAKRQSMAYCRTLSSSRN
jgi:hypothetical protein